MQPLKLLAITALYPPFHLGGYEIRSKNILDNLQQRGHSVRILCSSYQGWWNSLHEKEIYRVLHSESSRNLLQRVWWDYCDLHFIRKQIQLYQPDVIYLFHTIQLTRTLFPFLAQNPWPIVYDEGSIGLARAWINHGGWIRFCERQSTKRWKELGRRTGRYIVSTASGRLLPYRWDWPKSMSIYFNSKCGYEVARVAGVPLSKSRIIYSGLDIEIFPFVNRPCISHPLNLITVPGRITPIKGIESALVALSELCRLRPDLQMVLKIIGAVVDEEYYHRLQMQVIELGLELVVQFISFTDYIDMPFYYQLSDICLQPSYQEEGFSRVPLEAMASGSLLISSGKEGSAEIIENQKTGFIINHFDPAIVATTISKLVDNPEVYRTITKEARRKVEAQFTLDRYVDQIEQVLFDMRSQTFSATDEEIKSFVCKQQNTFE